MGRIKIKTVKTDSFSMDYFRFGQGNRVLVILPGLSVRSVMLSADMIADAYETLADKFTVYVFDRRRDLPPVYTIRDMARDTAEAFRALELEKVCLFGASQGGMIAQVIAIEHPELVFRMVLGSTTPHIRPSQFEKIKHWIDLAEKRDRTGLYLAFGQEIYTPEVFAQAREGLIKGSAAVTDGDLERFIILAGGIRDFNVTDELERIQCPVLAVGAYEDSIVDSDATMERAEKLEFTEGSKLYMYIGYGHAAFDTAPDYRQRLLDFFTEQ